MTDTSGKGKTVAMVILTVLAFSAIEVTAHPIRHRIDPAVMNFWRFLLGAAILLPYTLWRGNQGGEGNPLTRRDLLALSGLGFLNVVLAMGAFALSIKHLKAGTAAILIAANPISTNVFSRLILGETLTGRRLFALIAGIGGVCLVALKPAPGQDSMFGMLAGLIGMTGFSLYTVLSRSLVQRLGGLRTTTYGFTAGVILNVPILLASGSNLRPESDIWPRLLFLGFFVTGIGYLAFFQVLKALPPGKTSLLFFLKPPVSLLLAWVFLGEALTPAATLGAIIIMAGIALDLLSR
jgi:drug/metabolite transporter (DMT)-like permease